MTKLFRFYGPVIFIGLLMARYGEAASFDCAKASTPVEKMICEDAELSELDEQLHERYQKAMAAMPEPDKAGFKKAQRAWLKETRNICWETDCLRATYQQRIKEFDVGSLSADAKALPSEKKASSERYRLVEGKGYTVCEAFLKNLNAFPETEPPMVCEQKIYPSHPEFTRPQWEELDVQSNLKLIYDAEALMVVFTPSGTEPKRFEAWENKYQERIKSGMTKPRLRKTVLDLNGSGLATLIWYEDKKGECQEDYRKYGLASGPGGYMFIKRTPDEKLEKFAGIIGSDGRTDVFLYRGKPYFSTSGPWRVLGKTKNTPIWTIGFHPVHQRQTLEGQFGINNEYCRYHADRSTPQAG